METGKGKTPAEKLAELGLTPRLRRTLIAHLVDGARHVDIAKAHGIKPNSSRMRAYRARRKLAAVGLQLRPASPAPHPSAAARNNSSIQAQWN